MTKGDYLSTILKSNKTVFSLIDISLLWGVSSADTVKSRLNYYVKKNDLYHIKRGFYSKDKQYNKLELATKIFTPSYITFETVLAREGLIFQYQNKITVASYLTREIEIDGSLYSFKKIKNTVLTDSIGVNQINETSVASKERAFLDIIYSNIEYHFDNLRSIDWERVFTILPIYKNKRMTKVVNKIFKDYGGKQ
jgi:hypothetical protein